MQTKQSSIAVLEEEEEEEEEGKGKEKRVSMKKSTYKCKIDSRESINIIERDRIAISG